jgi:Na+/proline symporter
MDSKRKVAALTMGAIGLIHLVLAPEYMEEQAYIGVLFIAGAIASGIVAVLLWKRDDMAAWIVGALAAAGMGVGFVLSRTTGLPGFHEGEWELSGILSLLLEGGFVALALSSLKGLSSGRRESAAIA